MDFKEPRTNPFIQQRRIFKLPDYKNPIYQEADYDSNFRRTNFRITDNRNSESRSRSRKASKIYLILRTGSVEPPAHLVSGLSWTEGAISGKEEIGSNKTMIQLAIPIFYLFINTITCSLRLCGLTSTIWLRRAHIYIRHLYRTYSETQPNATEGNGGNTTLNPYTLERRKWPSTEAKTL